MIPVPVLLYHSVASEPSSWISGFTVSPRTFAHHMGILADTGRTALTVSELRDVVRGNRQLPDRPVVVTFDDGFADTLTAAQPALAQRGLSATVYVTTGVIGGVSPGHDPMLDWPQLRELALTTEIGAHSHTHPELDMLAEPDVRREVTLCKEVLEDGLEDEIPSFAYPFGYSNPLVRRVVAEAGYDSACSVKNALSSVADPRFAAARLTVTPRTTERTLRSWLDGRGAPVGRSQERPISRAWRAWRWTRSHWRAPDAWTEPATP